MALLPILGFPQAWESAFQVLSGLSIVTIIIWANIDKRLSLKAKAQKRQAHKVRTAEIAAAPDTSQNTPPPTGEI